MADLRKLIVWIFACALILCVLRYGLLENASQYLYNLRNEHIPSFAHRYDDYLPYLPLVVMLGLKLAGVESRSSWKPMIICTVCSFALMWGVVGAIKALAGVLRPDGSNLFSFPSGHTATAFTAATLLYKEYSKSKWIKSLTFVPATITGLTRILNNRHWLSDVVGGATVGITAVQVIYYLSDLIYTKKGTR